MDTMDQGLSITHRGVDLDDDVTYTIYLLTAIGQPPVGSSTVHVYTHTVHRTTQNKQYIEQHKHFGRVWAVFRLCGFNPGI